MFDDKSKPTAPADNAQANVAVKGDRPQREGLPPMDRKVVEKLKQEAGAVKFTTVTFKTHSDKCDAASFKKNSGRLCYWCVEEQCLKERMKAWYKQETNAQRDKEYAQRDKDGQTHKLHVPQIQRSTTAHGTRSRDI